jgi:hypothetical protein
MISQKSFFRLSGLLLTLLVVLPQKITHAESNLNSSTSEQNNCYPPPDSKQPQYIIGYGSLMKDSSRQRTTPRAGTAYPVMVRGYRRGWFAKGGRIGFDATYLGVVPQPNSNLNAVIYSITDPTELLATDKREYFYCRRLVNPSEFTVLRDGLLVEPGQAWIYTLKQESMAIPSVRYPIAQSYVDIFLSGCLEQEERYNLKDFARQCLTTTTDWSEHWVNDRIYPRQPFFYEPKASAIDQLINKQLPNYFRQIHIESTQ